MNCNFLWALRDSILVALLTGLLIAAGTGCNRKEKVIDVEAPGVDVEVKRDIDSGSVDVEVNE